MIWDILGGWYRLLVDKTLIGKIRSNNLSLQTTYLLRKICSRNQMLYSIYISLCEGNP